MGLQSATRLYYSSRGGLVQGFSTLASGCKAGPRVDQSLPPYKSKHHKHGPNISRHSCITYGV